jgi:hypothetical protein
MQVFDLPNVRRKEEYKDHDYKVQSKVEEVITKCAMNNPLWQFIATHYSSYSNGFNKFEVRASNDEILGTIASDWVRGTTGVCIENDRIKSKRTRSGGYTTTDVNKALLQIKKTFAPMNVLERAGKASKEAKHVMEGLISRERYDARDLERDIHGEANGWVLGTGFPDFLEAISKEKPMIYERIVQAVKKRKAHIDTLKQAENVWEGISDGGSILLVKEGSNYILQHKGKVSVFDDEHIPEEYKANLGMLKLVDSKVLVENKGCRINDNTFLIIHEEKKDEQQSNSV